MFHLIRNSLMEEVDHEPVTGGIEMDETYVGGKLQGREVRARG